MPKRESIRLWPWRPGVRERRIDTPTGRGAETVRLDDADAVLNRFNLVSTADLQGLHRALGRPGVATRLYQPGSSTPRGGTALAETSGLALRWRVAGAWHALPCPRSGTPGWAHPEATEGPGPEGLVDEIVYRLTVRRRHEAGARTTSVIDLGTDIAVVDDRSTWPSGRLLVTAQAAGREDECAAFLAAACFAADLGPQNDSLETQHRRFIEHHRHAVTELTAGPVEAARSSVEALARRWIAPAVPAGHRAAVSISGSGAIAADVEPVEQEAGESRGHVR